MNSTIERLSTQKNSPTSTCVLACAVLIKGVKNSRELDLEVNSWEEILSKPLYASLASAIRELLHADPIALTTRIAQISNSGYSAVDYVASVLRDCGDDKTKLKGAVYTPYWLAERLTKNALRYWQMMHRSGRRPIDIADLSCGVGAFLLAAQTVFGQESNIIGQDNDVAAITIARLVSELSNLKWDLKCQDSLFTGDEGRSSRNERQYDLLIGNPPYVRSPLLAPEYSRQIRILYPSTSIGNFDLSVAFIEQALSILRPDGIASYVLTSKFMASEYGKSICERLARDARVINIEDFQDAQIFPGYTTYTCILTFAKKNPGKRFTITKFPRATDDKHPIGQGESSSLAATRLLTHPWDFASGPSHDIIRKMTLPGNPSINQVFGDITQGLRTGSNPVFVLEPGKAKGIEERLLVPFVSGEHIKRCRLSLDGSMLLFPYKFSSYGSLELLREEELRTSFPNAWAHLTRYKSLLHDRAADDEAPWYAYSRSQNLDFFRKPKLLVKEMMPRAEFAADIKGVIAFCSGYGLDASRLDTSELIMWTAILSTPTMEFQLRNMGTQLHSGWFRLLKHHLLRVRLPPLSSAQRGKALKLSEDLYQHPEHIGSLDALDSIVHEAFNLTSQHSGIIQKHLSDCHEKSLPRKTRQLPPTSISFKDKYEPVKLEQYTKLHRERFDLRRLVTFAPNKKRPVHGWYQYTQGYSSDLVEKLLKEFGFSHRDVVLDPFAGSGTTAVVCREQKIASINIEVSPLMSWVINCKTTVWNEKAISTAIEKFSLPKILSKRLPTKGVFGEYLGKAYAPGVLSQLWSLADHIHRTLPKPTRDFFNLALVGIMEEVSQIRKHGSHYRFLLNTDSIGVHKLNIPVVSANTDIGPIYLNRLQQMLNDIHEVRFPQPTPNCKIILGDARRLPLRAETVSGVITSPPYLNRNNYISQQKAELAILSLVKTQEEYKAIVRSTLRSHVEGVLGKEPETRFDFVNTIIKSIVLTENNNKKIPHMIAGYFEDMDLTLREIARVLKPGGVAAFILGNTRWGGVVVPVDHMILKIAELNGLKAERVLITRLKGNSPQQMKRFGRIPVRESIVIVRKPLLKKPAGNPKFR